VIAATNSDLTEDIQAGRFREDLYYRLNVIPIDLPPLRKRGDDIKLLVNFFLERAMKNHKKVVSITDEAMEKLMRYPWPGNVREMENTIERIVLMGDESGISATDMLLLLPALKNENLVDEYNAIPMENKTLDELECEAITKALKQCDNNQSKAAKMLGITVRQIGYKVKKYGL
jgi:Nif-specific regulatory protein